MTDLKETMQKVEQVITEDLALLMAEYGFKEADREIRPRIIMSVAAKEKQGKTHFALEAPGPIALFNLDIGTEGVIHKFPDKLIIEQQIEIPAVTTTVISEAQKIWEGFKKANNAVLRSPSIRTVIYDTATELWELIRLAKLGKLTKVLPHNYTDCNAEFRRIIRKAYGSDKNVILLHKMKAEWVNDKRTGKYERAGFTDTGFLVQVDATIERLPDLPDDATPQFMLVVNESRHNPTLRGAEFAGPDMCTFQMLAALTIEGTTPEDWE